MNLDLELCLFGAFGPKWHRPDGQLDSGYYPISVGQVFGRKKWVEIDRGLFRENWAVLADLTPQWFVHYTPMVFLSALEETILPKYLHDSGWIGLYCPGSMFDGAFIVKGMSVLDHVQKECLCSIAAFLDANEYATDELEMRGTFESLLRTYLG